jgi:prophage regulatory protein
MAAGPSQYAGNEYEPVRRNLNLNTKPPEAAMERFLPEKIVKERTSLSRVVRWRMVRNGSFPAPVPISPGRVAWPESAINRWIAERIAAAA